MSPPSAEVLGEHDLVSMRCAQRKAQLSPQEDR